jgi:hypothetical protein
VTAYTSQCCFGGSYGLGHLPRSPIRKIAVSLLMSVHVRMTLNANSAIAKSILSMDTPAPFFGAPVHRFQLTRKRVFSNLLLALPFLPMRQKKAPPRS